MIMKKKLLTLSLAVASLMSVAQDVVIIEDFDSNRNLNTWIPEGGSYFNSTAEAPGSTADTVGKYVLTVEMIEGEAAWIGSRVDKIMGSDKSYAGYNIDEYPYFTIDAFSDESFNLSLKLEDKISESIKNDLQQDYDDYVNTNEWQTLYFDFSESIDKSTDVELLFFIDLYNPDTEKTFYFNNFKAYRNNPLGLDKVNKNSKLVSLFPNPASTSLTINSELTDVKSITIYDNYGSVVLQQNVNATKKINISDLANGTYSVLIATDNNVFSDKFAVVK